MVVNIEKRNKSWRRRRRRNILIHMYLVARVPSIL